MPSVSPKQAALMRAVANNAAFASKVGIPQNVGQEFASADAMKKQPTMPMLPRGLRGS